MLQNPHVLLTFDKVHIPLRLPRKSTSERPKVLRTRQFFALLTSICATPHNGVHFFDISTSKSGPRMVCFVHFHFDMCYAPQRRALFRHLNFQKWSENGVFCTFSLRNVLRATTACTFSSLIWPAGSAPAALASLLFDPPEPQIRKNIVFRDFPIPFRAAGSSFFQDFLFSDLLSATLLFSLPLPISAFHLSILPEVWLLNFLRQYPSLGEIWYIPLNLALKNSHWRHKNGSLRLPGCLHNRDENRCTIDFCVFREQGSPKFDVWYWIMLNMFSPLKINKIGAIVF